MINYVFKILHKTLTVPVLIFSIFLFAAFCLSGCNKANDYYNKLDKYPEVLNTYETVYGVGDTISIEGRLNPQYNLKIQIGGIDAAIAETGHSFVDSAGTSAKIDKIKIIITKEMGIGSGRSVSITSGGATIQAPSIEIIESSNSGYLSGPVQWQRHAALSVRSTPLYCQNGKGTVFIWNADNTVSRIGKDGTVSRVYDGSTLKDANGSFNISLLNAGGIDPQEKNLYFSAVTTDSKSDNASNEIYRFCKVNLQSGELTTLNRTLYPKRDIERTLESAKPFEGPINSVKIYQATGIYPDSKGNVFIQLALHVLSKLDSNGGLKYLFNYNNFSYTLLPRIWNPSGGYYQQESVIIGLLPGVKTKGSMLQLMGFAPDEGLMYGKLDGIITLFDIENQADIYGYNFSYWNPVTAINLPYISGSFPILTLPAQVASIAQPGQKLLLQYAGSSFRETAPSLGILNFKLKKGERYAPGNIPDGNYNIVANTDLWLNYDEEGMIYSTANGKSAVVKSQYK